MHSGYKVVLRTSDLSDAAKTVAMLERMFNEIYLVGGAVRDEIIGRKSYDLDFAVPDKPTKIIDILEANNMPVYRQGLLYNTVGTAAGGFDIQITTYRSEEYITGSRNPSVEAIEDIYSDLERRDFTVNAMALSRNEFIDPYDGLGDIKLKKVRCVGSAEERFLEDPLRILRAYRLVSVFGFNVDATAIAALSKCSKHLKDVSEARIGEELRKIIDGDYWSDAFFELIDRNIFTICLSNFGMNIQVNIDHAFSVLDKYSSNELLNMSEAERWICIAEIVYEAERDSGASTVDLGLTAEHIALKAQLPKNIKTLISDSIAQSSSQAIESTVIRRLTDDYEGYVSKVEVNAKKTHAKLLTELGKRAYFEKQFRVAQMHFKDSMSVTAELFDSAIAQISDKELKSAQIKTLSKLYAYRYSFQVAAYVMEEKLYTKFDSTRMLEKYISKQVHAQRLNHKDKRIALQEGIVKIYRENIHDNKLESFEEFIESDDCIIPDDRADYLLKSYLSYQLRLSKDDYVQRAKYNKKLANLIKRGRNSDQLGLNYYDHHVDYLYYHCLTSKDLDTFCKRFDILMEAMPDYMSTARREGKLWYAEKRAYLNSASCNTYALSIAKTLSEKIYYAQRAVEDYSDAGDGHIKNAKRYGIYVDWFKFVEWICDQPLERLNINDIHNMVQSYDSYKYVDRDENFFTTRLVELSKLRDMFGVVFSWTILMRDVGRPVAKTLPSQMAAIATLFHAKMIDEHQSVVLFRNFLIKSSADDVEIVEIDTDDIVRVRQQENEIEKLVSKGESSTLEFKASWAYDMKSCGKNKQIGEGIIKSITAFMNTEGGKILIGVGDDKTITGLESTDFKIFKKGKTKSQWVDEVTRDISSQFANFVGQDFQWQKKVYSEQYRDKTILVISVSKSDTAVFFKDEFYIRSDGESVPLTTAEFSNYQNTRFSS